MISSHHPSHNRLLDLDHTLLGWKQSAADLRSDESSQSGQGETPLVSDRGVDEEAEWEEEENWQATIDHDEAGDQDEWDTQDATEFEAEGVAAPDWFSYRRLADRLESRARELEYGTIRQHLLFKDAAVEVDDTLLEPSFFSDSRSGTPITSHPSREQSIPLTSSLEEPTSRAEAAAFGQPNINLPDIDLPNIDLPDIDLPDIDLPDAPSAASADGSDENASYQSLVQIIQAVRQSDLTADFEDEAFGTAHATRTIDVAAQAIANSQDDWEEVFSDLADPAIHPIPPLPDTVPPIS